MFYIFGSLHLLVSLNIHITVTVNLLCCQGSRWKHANAYSAHPPSSYDLFLFPVPYCLIICIDDGNKYLLTYLLLILVLLLVILILVALLLVVLLIIVLLLIVLILVILISVLLLIIFLLFVLLLVLLKSNALFNGLTKNFCNLLIPYSLIRYLISPLLCTSVTKKRSVLKH